MRSFILYFLLFCAYPCVLSAQWTSTNGPEGANAVDLFKDNQTFWASCSGGLYFSTDEGLSWQAHPNFSPGEKVYNVVRKGGALFALSLHYFPFADTYFELKKSDDDGLSWYVVGDLSSITAFDPSEVKLVEIQGNLCILTAQFELYWSANEGASWQVVPNPDIFSSFNFEPGGQCILAYSYTAGLYVSTDMGQAWQLLADSSRHFGYVQLIQDSLIVVEDYDLGVGRHLISHDLGQTWTPIDSMPLGGFAASFEKGRGDTIYAFNDHAFVSPNKGHDWVLMGPAPFFVSPFLKTSTGGLRYWNAAIQRFSEADHTWTSSEQGLSATYIVEMEANDAFAFALENTGNIYRKAVGANGSWEKFVLPNTYYNKTMELSGDTLFVGSYNDLLRITQNGAGAVEVLATGLPVVSWEDFSMQGASLVVSTHNQIFLINRHTGAFQEVPLPPGTGKFNHFLKMVGNRWVYADNEGSVFISDNQGTSWQQTYSQWLPGNNTGNALYVALDNLILATRNGLAISSDQGATWSASVSGLPKDAAENLYPIMGLEAQGDLLFLTLYRAGEFVSADKGFSWQPFGSGLHPLRAICLAANSTDLFVGTTSAGVWQRPVALHAATGTVFFDLNGNEVQDNGELPAPEFLVSALPNGLMVRTNTNGVFTNLAAPGDTIRVHPPSAYLLPHPAYQVVGPLPANPYDVAIEVMPNMSDLRIALTLNQQLVPGFGRKLYLTCTNIGTLAQAPEVVLHMPPGFLLQFTNPPAAQVAGDSIVWHLPVLEPLQSIVLVVDFTTPVSALIGEVFSFEAAIYPVAGDQTPDDNYAGLREQVVGSYDPNDKKASPEAYFTPDQLAAGESIAYTIRFQNTGNFPATFVRVVDTLANYLDPTSIQIVAHSHPMSWSLRGQHTVEFLFDDIQLPDSTWDEPNSHGFVQFRIKPRASVPLNASISNRAFIYFDFNAPVETNTVKNVVAFPLTTFEATETYSLLLLPNPTDGLVQVIRAVSGNGFLQVFDALGKRVFTQTIQSARTTLDLSGLAPGMYTVQVVEPTQTGVGQVFRK